jgi:hypothetical protein
MDFCFFFVSFASKTTYTQTKGRNILVEGFQSNKLYRYETRNNYKAVVDDGGDDVLSLVRVDGK